MTNTNLDGGYTTSVPVSGQLNGLGQVHGVWYESTDQFGDYLGPDTITLHDAQGGFTIAFSNASPGPAHKNGAHRLLPARPAVRWRLGRLRQGHRERHDRPEQERRAHAGRQHTLSSEDPPRGRSGSESRALTQVRGVLPRPFLSE